MVDDVNITETAESKASQEALDRARLARERREAEQRKRLDELRAHAAAAQAQREKRDEDRRRRQAEQRARDDDRRQQVEERKRAIWEASISRREALLQREKDRSERLERQRAARSAPRPAFAFGSSTPRLLEPLDSAGFFWAARSTNPIDQMNFFESLAASTTNVMFASAPLTRRASALQLDMSDNDNKDESDRPTPVVWCSVARRRTDLVPTVPAPRPGRAYSMTRLDRLPGTPQPTTHISRIQSRSGETTPGSRPGSALSTATGGAGAGAGAGTGAGAGVVRRPHSARKPRPASIAGTGVNTPRGVEAQSASTTPGVSRDSSALSRPATATRKPRPLSIHSTKPLTPVAPGDGKPPLHRKPKPAKENDKSGRNKSLSASPGRTLSPSPATSKDPSVDKDIMSKSMIEMGGGDNRMSLGTGGVVSAAEVTHKLEALQIHGDTVTVPDINKVQESSEQTQQEETTKPEPAEPIAVKPIENDSKPVEKTPLKEDKKEEKREEKKEPSVEKTDDYDMTASMTARRITTEEQAKAALAERRRRAREELERQAELERQRLQREAEEEAERQRQEEERQKREEEEARELAALQRKMEDEKLRKAIEAQQQLEREEAERKTREEAERQAKQREENEKRKAAEEAERIRREEAEREERERVARKQRVEAIMARTRLRKAEEDKKQQEQQNKQSQSTVDSSTNNVSSTDNVDSTNNGLSTNDVSSTGNGLATNDVSSTDNVVSSTVNVDNVSSNNDVSSNEKSTDNGNVATGDLLGFNNTSQSGSTPVPPQSEIERQDPSRREGEHPPNNGNDLSTHTLHDIHSEDQPKQEQQSQQPPTTTTTKESNNGNAHLTADFIAHEIQEQQQQQKLPDKMLPDMLADDFTTHNGHSNHPLTLQNAI